MRGWLVLVLVLVTGCSKGREPPPAATAPLVPAPVASVPAAPRPPTTGDPVEPGTIRKAVVEEGYAVVVPNGGNADAIVKRIDAALATAKLDAKVQKSAPKSHTAEEKQALAYINPQLTPHELDDVLGGTTVMIGVSGEPAAMLRKLGPIARDAATAAHGWIIDPYISGVYTPSLFEKHIAGDVLDVRGQIAVHAVQGDNDAPFLDTAGMGKLGLPDLFVSAISEGDDRILSLVNATAQSLLMHGDVTSSGVIEVDLAELPGDWKLAEIKRAGGTGKARWRVRWHDDNGELDLQLIAPRGASTEALAALLDECYGKRADETAMLKDDDPDLVAAKAQAQHDLAAMRPVFQNGVPGGEHLAVKAPFRDAGQTEWMWVDVFAWKANELTGSLANTPDFVHNVKLGQRVTIKLADVADYVRVTADGSRQGGYSTEILKKRGVVR